MKTNSKIVRLAIRQHIHETVTDSNGDTLPTYQEAARVMWEEFERVANHPYNLRRLPNTQERFSDYLMGLPFHFEYTHTGIADFLNGLGINPTGKSYDGEKSARLYHYLIFSETEKTVRALTPAR